MSEHPIDVLITGKEPSDIHGTIRAHNIHRSPELPNVPILVVGYQCTKEDVLRAVDRGINSVQLMPFSPGTLQEKIARMTHTMMK
jgi:CheY-like chemotaxis protein